MLVNTKNKRERAHMRAIDYPINIIPTDFVIWYSAGYNWPDPRRSIMYLSDKRTHFLEGWALFVFCYEDATTFKTIEDAEAFLKFNENMRRYPYTGIRLTTWKVLIEEVFETTPQN